MAYGTGCMDNKGSRGRLHSGCSPVIRTLLNHAEDGIFELLLNAYLKGYMLAVDMMLEMSLVIRACL